MLQPAQKDAKDAYADVNTRVLYILNDVYDHPMRNATNNEMRPRARMLCPTYTKRSWLFMRYHGVIVPKPKQIRKKARAIRKLKRVSLLIKIVA